MAPAEKIQGEEKAFLESKFSEYLAHATAGTYYVFWPLLFRLYFEAYPAPVFSLPDLSEGAEESIPEDLVEEDVDVGNSDAVKRKAASDRWRKLLIKLRGMTEAQQTKWCEGKGLNQKKGQLRTWFRWRQTKLAHSTGTRAPTSSITALFAASGKSRLLTQIEKYSKLYFPTRVRHVVAKALTVYGDHPTRAQTLITIKKVTSEMWEAEDDETREEVFAAMALDKAKRDSALLNQTSDSESRTPVQYQSSIDTLAPLLKQIFDELSKTTGWAFTILMGGPVPQADGNITSASHHSGVGTAGNDWGRAYPDFDKAIIGPYQDFLRHIYPSEVRRQRALQPIVVAKEPSMPPDMLPFHEKDLGLGQDSAGDAFMMELFDSCEALVPGMKSPDTAPSTPARSRSDSPFNPFLISTGPASDSDYTLSHPPSHTLLPPVPATPTSPTRIAGQALTSATPCAPPALNPVVHPASPFPESTLPDLPDFTSPPLPASTPTPLPASTPITVPSLTPMAHPAPMPVARPKPKVVTRPIGSVIVSSVVNTVQAQSTDAQERYALLKSNSSSDTRKARLLALEAKETAEDAAQAALTAADVAEILALKQPTRAEEEKAHQAAIVAAKSVAAAEREAIAIAAEAPRGKENALARLLTSRTSKAARVQAAREVVQPPTRPAPDVEDQTTNEGSARHSLPTSSIENTADPGNTGPATSASPNPGDEEAPRLTKSQKAAAKRKEKAEEKATKKAHDAQVLEQARVDREAAYGIEMTKRNAGELINNPFSVPDNAQPWVRPLVDYLTGEDLGGEWRACIRAFVLLLKDMGCVEMPISLSTKHRPLQVAAWINRARKLEKTPPVAKLYLAEWMRWWCALQPAWRQGTGSLPPALYTCEAGEWGTLRNCGKNGLALVLLAVAWYGYQFGAEPEWVVAITDVRRALEGMIQGGIGSKRAASVADVTTSDRRSKRPKKLMNDDEGDIGDVQDASNDEREPNCDDDRNSPSVRIYSRPRVATPINPHSEEQCQAAGGIFRW
ncbi:hypothetical protein HWV62_14626 [Athelia sp. TMB]|nr:hypothetical protein HWV62_14626 [Athelia sp. TMB]